MLGIQNLKLKYQEDRERQCICSRNQQHWYEATRCLPKPLRTSMLCYSIFHILSQSTRVAAVLQKRFPPLKHQHHHLIT